MIFLVGTGLSKGDLTQKAIETCAKGELFLDKYTSKVNGETLTAIKKSTGKVPTTLSRSEMEERAQELVEKAKEKDIVIIVGGDPLIATTHKILAPLRAIGLSACFSPHRPPVRTPPRKPGHTETKKIRPIPSATYSESLQIAASRHATNMAGSNHAP